MNDPTPASGLRIVPLDPYDDAATAAWHASYVAADTYQREHATPWQLEEMRAGLRADSPGEEHHAWSGVLGGEVVVTATVELPLMDNRDQVWLELHTRPDQRNRGYGSAMLEHVLAWSRDRGRTVVGIEVAYPYDSPTDGAGHPGVEFLRRRGFTFGIGDVQRVLDLPVADVLLDRLVAEAAPHHPDYTLRQFAGPVPDDIVESYGRLVGTLNTEAPMGDLVLEAEVFDVDRIRADERRLAEQGRTKYTTVALAPDRGVAAYTEILVPAHDPGRAYQWGTLVDPAHRGHRLGLAVKALNQRFLQRDRPDLRSVHTYNAEVNRHMIAVNERLGFRPVERLGEFQRRLGPGTPED